MQALDDLKVEAIAVIEAAADSAALEKLRVEWLGKKGRVTDLLKSLGQLEASERPKMGAEINAVKQLLNSQQWRFKKRSEIPGPVAYYRRSHYNC